ncbi:DUF1294 domain-containing protein [Marinomonas dokdonensis]|uniref:DUF1294 domain-containing protein n=1 Tax=Marinomonas dokdonensis TaxID=328224 RepID=UPI0040559686
MVYFYAYLILLNSYTLVCYGLDKMAAKRGRWRVSEFKLHLLSLLGGWPGAMLSQKLFRHKVSKKRFRRLYHLMIFINLLLSASGFYLLKTVFSLTTGPS